MQFEDSSSKDIATDRITTLNFEIDDQTPEDLAIGINHIRASEDVVDVLQSPVFAKQGRQATHVQVLCKPERTDAVTELCFRETTTIGIRIQLCDRKILQRRELKTDTGANVKVVARPGGDTAKADISDFADVVGFTHRNTRRGQAQEQILSVEQDEKTVK